MRRAADGILIDPDARREETGGEVEPFAGRPARRDHAPIRELRELADVGAEADERLLVLQLDEQIEPIGAGEADGRRYRRFQQGQLRG